MKEFSAFQEKVLHLLKKRKYDKISKILKNSSTEKLVSENVWTIIKLVYETADQSMLTSETDVKRCRKILTMLIEKDNPNKMLLALLEQPDWFKADKFFYLLLNPLHTIFKKIPGKRGKSLQWVLTALSSQIESHEALTFWQQVGVFSFFSDKLYILSDYIDFLEYFVDEVSFENLKTREIYYYDRIYNQQEMLQNFILKLYYHPFLYFVLEEEEHYKKTLTIQVLCEKGINMLSKICHNVFNLFDIYNLNINKRQVSSDVSVPLLAFSNLSYLTFVGDMSLAFQPFVYTHHFIFQSQLKYMIHLLKQNECIVLSKGVQLAEKLLDKIDDGELIYDCINSEQFSEFPKLLCDITLGTGHELCMNEKVAAYKIFLKFAAKLDVLGQYNLIMFVLSCVKQSNIISHMIVLYRKNVEIGLNGCNCKHRKLFFGKNLATFLKKTCVVENEFEHILNDDSNKMQEILDLLKFLFVQDVKSRNLSGVWDNVPFISKKFLRPLANVAQGYKTQLKAIIKEYNMHKKNFENAAKSDNQNIPTESKLPAKSDLQNALTRIKRIEKLIVEVRIITAT